MANLLEQQLNEMGRGVAEIIRDAITPLRERIAALEEKLAAAEERLADCLCYRGTYSAFTRYVRGDTITHGGALWSAIREIETGRPGDADSGWVLVAKSPQPPPRPRVRAA